MHCLFICKLFPMITRDVTCEIRRKSHPGRSSRQKYIEGMKWVIGLVRVTRRSQIPNIRTFKTLLRLCHTYRRDLIVIDKIWCHITCSTTQIPEIHRHIFGRVLSSDSRLFSWGPTYEWLAHILLKL
jgi:hypothetical protein